MGQVIGQNGGVIESWIDPPPPPPSQEELRRAVDAERDRRIAGGVAFGGKRFQTRPFDCENISGASTAALGAMVSGAQPGNLRWADPDHDFAWIAEDNSFMPMDAQTMFGFGQAVLTHRKALMFAGSALKARIANGEAVIIDDDANWPAE